GLAVAHARPAPVQDAVSHLGIGTPSHHSSEAQAADDTPTTTFDPTVTTTPDDVTFPAHTTPTSAQPDANHGAVVSGVAHDHSTDGCEHGAAVSNVASDGRTQSESQDTEQTDTRDTSENDINRRSCETPTSVANTTTPTTIDNP